MRLKNKSKIVGVFIAAAVLLMFYANCSFTSTSAPKSNSATATPSPYLPGIDTKIVYQTDQIQKIDNALLPPTLDPGQNHIVSVDGYTLKYMFYRNNAYRCGKSGNFTFLVIEQTSPTNTINHAEDLWVYMHGGGFGYYFPDPNTGKIIYSSSENLLDEETVGDLFGDFQPMVTRPNGTFKAVNLARRFQEGQRILVTSMCDHDYYAGMGNIHPRDPNWPGNPDKVEGMLATMSAIEFMMKGNKTYPGYASTGKIWLHGTSAGSAGAYHVSMGFLNNGIRLTGVLMDSGFPNTRLLPLIENGCQPMARTDISAAQVEFYMAEKAGPFLVDTRLLAENNLGANHLSTFMLQGTLDEQCCGNIPPVPPEAQAFGNNCLWAYDNAKMALAQHPENTTSQIYFVPGAPHVISDNEESDFKSGFQTAIEQWIQKIKASNPPPITF